MTIFKLRSFWTGLPGSSGAIRQPFFPGSFVVSGFASAAGCWAMRGFWRPQTVRQWERCKRVRERKA